jgi:hypothetical protein
MLTSVISFWVAHGILVPAKGTKVLKGDCKE